MGTNGKKFDVRKTIPPVAQGALNGNGHVNGKTKYPTGLGKRGCKDQIVMAYCHNGMVHEPFMTSILNTAWYDGKHRKLLHSVCKYRGLYIDSNRNFLVRLFLSQDAEWMLMLDTDIAFPANAMYMLRDVADRKKRPMVTGLYFSRGLNENPDAHPVWYVPDPRDRSRVDGFTLCTTFTDGLTQLAAAGCGFLLIHRSVFDAFRGKYENEEWQWFGRDTLLSDDGRLMRMGEDITFFKRCRELNIPLYGHGGCVVDHIKTRRENLVSYTASPNVKLYDKFEQRIVPSGEVSPVALGE